MKSRFVGIMMAVALAAAPSSAQSHPEFIQFNPSAVKGALYKPDSGSAPRVAVLIIHRTSNVLAQLATTELSKRGYLVLAVNPRSDNNEAAVVFEENALDLKSGVEFLRKQPGITKVLLLGGSGGGPATTFYQAVAEKGPGYCQGPNKLIECDSSLANLPPADGVILRDAHPGISVNILRQLNPAVLDESDPRKIDSGLDPFSPANGFVADKPSHYSDGFKEKYFKAQAARMNRLIDLAQGKMKQMKAGTYLYPDDDAFIVVRGGGPRLMQLDPSIHHSTLKPHQLLKNDGSVVTQIIESVRPVPKGVAKFNASFGSGTLFLTLRSFLTANAVRSTDSMDGIDSCSSNNSTPCALRAISVPVLITAMQGHYFIRDNEIHYDVAASKDKEYIVIEGATHGITPCTECETTPGQYSNSVKNFFDYLQKWIDARF
ncbi:MAG: hypothetical protein HY651_10325 [Acidobacteria bacterium]|nr:hypothetical protein [Acidobacteriota bacterium]